MAASTGSRFKELVKKYGKVAIGVHCSVSAASITGLYIAIKNNVDVESLFEKYHLPWLSKEDSKDNPTPQTRVEEKKTSTNPDGFVIEERTVMVEESKKRNRTAELASSTGGALALAILCNKALFPIRVPITMVLTPPVARFLTRRGIINKGV